MRKIPLLLIVTAAASPAAAQTCPFNARCTNNAFGAGGSFATSAFSNPYGSPFGRKSSGNPSAAEARSPNEQRGNEPPVVGSSNEPAAGTGAAAG